MPSQEIIVIPQDVLDRVSQSPSLYYTCAIGIYEGERRFPGAAPVRGWFGLVGIEEPCHEPVVFICHRANRTWAACAKPEHRQNAEKICDLKGKVVWQVKLNSEPERVPHTLPAKPKQLTARKRGK